MNILSDMSYAGNLPTTPDKDNPNKHYFVAEMYHDIWQRSNGQWTSDGQPNMIGKELVWNYSFDFPGRKIINVEIK
ncbi:hypothetical protein D3C77_731240 [compost metagenome]